MLVRLGKLGAWRVHLLPPGAFRAPRLRNALRISYHVGATGSHAIRLPFFLAYRVYTNAELDRLARTAGRRIDR